MARNSLLCADVPLRNYSLTHSSNLFIEHLSKVEAHILALRSLNLSFKYYFIIFYPVLLGAPLPLGALRVRVVCLWVNPALVRHIAIFIL